MFKTLQEKRKADQESEILLFVLILALIGMIIEI